MPDTLTLTIETAAGTRTGEWLAVGIHLDGQGNTVCSLVRPDDPSRIIVSGYCLRETDSPRFVYGGRVRSSPQRHREHRDSNVSGPESAKAVAVPARGEITATRSDRDRPDEHLRTDSGLAADAQLSPVETEAGRAVPAANSIPATFSGFWYCVDLLNILVRCFHASPASKVNGVRGMLQMLAPILQRFPRSGVVFAGEGGHAVRRSIYPTYKTHRPETPELLREQIALAIEAVQQLGWPVLSSPGYEADDVLAALAVTISERGGEAVVVSSDKDLRQLLSIEGVHVLDPGTKELIQPAQVREKFGVEASQLGDWLALTGDASDGVPGVTGIGPAAATELLTEHGTLDRVLQHAARLRSIEPKRKRWQQLVEQAETARLSRELVRLRTECPLPGGWWDWPVDTPCPGWQDSFRAKGLSAVIDSVSRITGLPAAHPRSLASVSSVISVAETAGRAVPATPTEAPDGSLLVHRDGSDRRSTWADGEPPGEDRAGDPVPLAMGADQLADSPAGSVLSGPGLPVGRVSESSEPEELRQPAHDRAAGQSDSVPAGTHAGRPVGEAAGSGPVECPRDSAGVAWTPPSDCPQFVRECIAAGLIVTAGPDAIVGNYTARTPAGVICVIHPACPPRPDLITGPDFESYTLAQFRAKFLIHHRDTESTEKPVSALPAPPRDPVPTFRTQAKGALF